MARRRASASPECSFAPTWARPRVLARPRLFWQKRPFDGRHPMKGIVLAGGTGSRLFPLTKVTNKHLLPVGRKPMIFHPIEKLLQAGVKEILIVTGVDHMGDVVGLLGSGREHGCEFTYRVQDQ